MALDLNDRALADFVAAQTRDFGGKVEIDQGIWALFGVPAADAAGNALAREMLTQAAFAHDSGDSDDDQWTLFYVDAANRLEAMHWLDDWQRRIEGKARLPTPAQRALIQDLLESSMPHRIAQNLSEAHLRGELSAGAIQDPALLRALLDRLHVGEPLFYSAFHQLLQAHLLDLVALLQQLIPEDVDHANETIRGSLSRDPFLRSRQTTAAEIRNHFIRFHLINSLDQQKNTAIRNPYAAYLELVTQGEDLALSVDGSTVATSRPTFVRAIRLIRRNLYRGGEFTRFDTQVPWMEDDVAFSFRFIKQRLEMRRELTPLDGLYILERAVD